MAYDQVITNHLFDPYDDFTFEQLEEAFSDLLNDYRKLRSKYETSKKVLKEYKGEIGRLTDLLDHVRDDDSSNESGELSSIKLLLHKTVKLTEKKDQTIIQLKEDLSKERKSLQCAQVRLESLTSDYTRLYDTSKKLEISLEK